MDLTQVPHAIVNGDALRIVAFSIGSAIFVLSLCYLLVSDPERAVDYEISIPEQCKPGWIGEELEEPSIKVCVSIIAHSRITHSTLVQRALFSVTKIWQKSTSNSHRYLVPQPYNAIVLLLVNHSDFSIQSLLTVSTVWSRKLR